MEKQIDIHKAGGILLKDRKLLVEKSFNKDLFLAPGGKLEKDETSEQALVRELEEEFNILVSEADLEFFGTFYAQSATNENLYLRMDIFIVMKWSGEPKASSEVEEIKWIDSKDLADIKVGSIFEHDVIPRLKAANLID